jgi:hypothetical protein
MVTLEREFNIPNPDDPFDFPPLPEEMQKPPFKLEIPVWPELRWGPANIRVLIVTDGAYYDEIQGFGVGIFLKDAFDRTHPEHPSYARFQFSHATHQNQYPGNYNPDPGFDRIQLTPDKLNGFDELWLFGVKTGAPYLLAPEIAAVEAFMDGGGGVLAMGDHEDLGLGLCGQIKRVRSMRKWWFQSPPPPPGMQVAPHSTDLSRNDTVHAVNPGGDVNLGDQNDATPQTIFPNYRYTWSWWHPRRRLKYPHPVLCGPRGAIRVMPDHAHEGDCILPDATFVAEYPGGVPVEVIARGRNVVGRTKAGYTVTDPREFGLIGVWDGHDARAEKGRVLVDSTWHHWFNINLVGLRAENGIEYKDILAYFRNVGIWLAPKSKQAAMRRAGSLVFMLSPSMIEHTLTLREFRADAIYRLGVYARDVLGRIAPQCQSSAWFIFWVEKLMPKAMIKAAATMDFKERIDDSEALAIDVMVASILGGIVNALAVSLNERGFENLETFHEEMDAIAERGGKLGVDVATKQLIGTQRQIKDLLG